jgi:hypothetical protein
VAFESDRVSFLWRDYAHGGKQKGMVVSAHEFLRRFLLHVLPGGMYIKARRHDWVTLE